MQILSRFLFAGLSYAAKDNVLVYLEFGIPIDHFIMISKAGHLLSARDGSSYMQLEFRPARKAGYRLHIGGESWCATLGYPSLKILLPLWRDASDRDALSERDASQRDASDSDAFS